jgi:hypothetical protein
MNKMSFEILIKEAILNTELSVGSYEVKAEQDGSKYNVFIIDNNDPDKKYLVSRGLLGAEVSKTFKYLKDMLVGGNAEKYLKGLKFFRVEAKKKK